ncbi:hypothetical protein [Sphingomonas sp. VNH70]|uniref:hypothetical protein n=1 Tax=Sphingomonas silueang TaxID=3156617 RepID=UPI0032B35715
MTAIRFAASTVLGLIAATSAFAAEPEVAAVPATVATTVATTTATAATPAAKPRKTRYCVRSEAMTGSRLTRMDCNTRGTWIAMGVDIDAMIANTRR